MRQAPVIVGGRATTEVVAGGRRAGRRAPFVIPTFGRASNPASEAEKSAASFLTDERALPWFLLAHAVIGALVFFSPAMAKVHFWATVVLVVRFATVARRPSDIAILAAYVAGAEVLWRMTQSAVFWETGKYAITALFLFGLTRFPHRQPMGLAILYFILLTPSILMVTGDFTTARKVISFNLSGPLSLAVGACFFRQCVLSRAELGGILLALAGPVTSIALFTVLSTYGRSDIAFGGGSNFDTSGGFGPNQVSAALSAGAIMCFLLLSTQADLRARRRVLLFAIFVVFCVQSAMTFSRGGLYLTGIAVLGGSLCLLGDREGRRMVVGSVLAIALAFGIAAPMLNRFTDGALEQRFQDTGTTGRAELTQDDLLIWAERPVLGAGVGQAQSNRTLISGSTHNEWTRMLAEHGAFGLASLVALLALIVGSVLRARGPVAKAVAAALVLWGASFLFANAWRIVAPGFFIALASATFDFPSGWRPFTRRRAQGLRPPMPHP